MANSEISINDKIADVFRAINTDWRVHDLVSSENTHGLLKKKALRPDIFIIEPGVPPDLPRDQVRARHDSRG